MNTVYCPVLDRQVDGNTCLEIVLVADREAKTSILPQGLEWNNSSVKSASNVRITMT